MALSKESKLKMIKEGHPPNMSYESCVAGNVPIPLEVLDHLISVVRRSVCKLKLPNGSLGSGAFYTVRIGEVLKRAKEWMNWMRFTELERNLITDPDELRFEVLRERLHLFITCNHVLPTNSAADISQVILELTGLDTIPPIKLNENGIFRCWTNAAPLIDATIVELSDELVAQLKSFCVEFLEVDLPKGPRERVAILQFPNGKQAFADGDIEEVDKCELLYRIGTACGSSGSPLMNLDNRAVGVHHLGEQPDDNRVQTSDMPHLARKACVINHVIAAFLTQRLCLASNAEYATSTRILNEIVFVLHTRGDRKVLRTRN